jgi:1-acyl-sn-glycerol-3-phosphate acyltransferase
MLYRGARRVIRPLFRLTYRPVIEGAEHVPVAGAAIVASNHLSVADSWVLPLVAPRPIAFLAKAEYFTGRGLKGRARRSLFTALDAIPVERGNGRAALVALDAAERVLGNGQLFGIYPEGTRSPDGRLHRGRVGVARLALRTGVPVIPVGLAGTDRVQPVGARVPHVAKVTIRFGTPLIFTKYRDMERNRTVQRAVVDEIMREICTLSGQEYVDTYGNPGTPAA